MNEDEPVFRKIDTANETEREIWKSFLMSLFTEFDRRSHFYYFDRLSNEMDNDCLKITVRGINRNEQCYSEDEVFDLLIDSALAVCDDFSDRLHYIENGLVISDFGCMKFWKGNPFHDSVHNEYCLFTDGVVKIEKGEKYVFQSKRLAEMKEKQAKLKERGVGVYEQGGDFDEED